MPVIPTICLVLVLFNSGVSTAAVETNSVSAGLTTGESMSVKDIEREVEELVKSATKMALNVFMRNSSPNVSSSCLSTIMSAFLDLRRLKLPVIKMLDAMSKPPSGLLRGSLSIMGDYDQCLEVKVNKKGDVALDKSEEVYHGQYCVVEAELPPAVANSYIDFQHKKINISAFGKLGEIINEMPNIALAEEYLRIRVGLCLPSSCSKNDLEEFLKILPIKSFPVRAKYCDDGQAQKWNVGQILFVTFIVLCGACVVSGTILEICFYVETSANKNQKTKLTQFLLAFSMYRNTKKLMKSERNSTSNQIPVMNGMYVIGSLFIIVYHTYFMPFFATYSSHTIYLGKYMNNWTFSIMPTMGIGIDAYFLFSGVFLVYSRYRREGKQVKVNVLRMIVLRYLRFCPAMLLILGVLVSLPLIGSGPVWPEIFGVAAENTRKWWWTYVLMFNNFLTVKDQSFFPLWFVACLMQLTIIGAVLLWFMSKDLKFGIFLTIITSVSCNIALGLLTYLRNYPLTYALYYYHLREYMEIPIYTSPLSHVSSYGIGMLLGYFMAKKHILKLSRIQVIIGWTCSLFFIFGTHFFCFIGHTGQDLDPIVAAVYAATHRVLYSFGISWIILACTYGYGGVLAEALSWKTFGVLAKLSYSGYLIHYIIIAYHVSITRVPLSFNHYEVFIRYCGYITVNMIATYLIYTTFELPMSYILSLLFPKKSDSNLHDNININIDDKCVNSNFSKENKDFNSSMFKPPIWEELRLPDPQNTKL